MIIECESCGTRFNLADGQIPAKGARVRCSKCHHRFHVMPAGDAGETPEEGADAEAEHVEVQPEAVSGSEDPDLENPEFLFDANAEAEDEEEEEPPPGITSAPAPEPEPDSGPRTELFGAGEAQPAEASADPDTALGVELSEPEVGGFAVGLDTDADGATSFADEAESAADVREQVFGIETKPEESGDVDAVDGFPISVPSPDSLSEDEIFGGDDTGAHSGLTLDAADDETELSRPGPGTARSTPVEPGALPQASLIDRLGSGLVRTIAIAVGLLLLVGGVRLLWLYGMGLPPGPEAVRSNGWIATEIDSLEVSDQQGNRVLVVRGTLTSESSSAPPNIQAILLDSSGGELPSRAVVVRERLSGQGLLPARVSERLQGLPAAAAAGGVSSGFTLLIQDPPASARRFRLQL